MTSLTCTSRQPRAQSPHWMQASSCTAIAGWLRSGAGWWRAAKRGAPTPTRSAQVQNLDPGSCASARGA
jgi:hypothetical protein